MPKKTDLTTLLAEKKEIESAIEAARKEQKAEEKQKREDAECKGRLSSELADAFAFLKDYKDALPALELSEAMFAAQGIYQSLHGSVRQFSNDATVATGIYNRLVQQLIQIAGIEKAARDIVRGSRVANYANLKRIARVPHGEQVALAEEICRNPPRSGRPTATLEKPVTETYEPDWVFGAEKEQEPEVVEEPSTGLQLFEGFPIDVAWPDGKPRIRDIDLALHLEMSRPRDIRKVAKEMPAELGIVELRARLARSRGVDGIVREMPVQEGWYTEEQAMWVTFHARTPKADSLGARLIQGFIAVRDFLAKMTPKGLDQALILAGLEAIIVASNQALEKKLFDRIDNAIAALTPSGPRVVVPQVGIIGTYSSKVLAKMHDVPFAVVKALSLALKLVGDPDFGEPSGVVTPHHGHSSDNWRHFDSAKGVLSPLFAQYKIEVDYFVGLRMGRHRERALEKVLATVTPVGKGTWTALSRPFINNVRPIRPTTLP